MLGDAVRRVDRSRRGAGRPDICVAQPGRVATVEITGGSPSAMMRERPSGPMPVTIRRMGGSSVGMSFLLVVLLQTTSASVPALGSPMAPVAANVVTLAPRKSSTGKVSQRVDDRILKRNVLPARAMKFEAAVAEHAARHLQAAVAGRELHWAARTRDRRHPLRRANRCAE